MVDWFKSLVDLDRDPVVMSLTDKEYRAYRAVLNDVARNERDGRYFFAGKPTRVVNGLIAKGALIPVDSPHPALACFEVYRASEMIPSSADLERKRAEGQERKDRWKARHAFGTRSESVPEHVPEHVPNAKGSKSLSTSKSEVVDGSQLPTSGQRDLAYEAFGDCWQGDWHGLPPDARGRINEALGSLRNMTENKGRSDSEVAAEIRRRWEHATAWQPEWVWTPQTFLRYWRRLDKPPAPPTRPESLRHQDRAAQILQGVTNGHAASDSDRGAPIRSLPA